MKTIVSGRLPYFMILAAVVSRGETPSYAADDAAVSVFNGHDLNGWIVEGTTERKTDEQTVPLWTAVDGEIRCAGGGFGFLRLDRKMCDFEFSAEIRLEPRANSGIGIRTVPYRGVRQTRPSFAGYELQLQDDGGRAADAHSSGSLYRYVAPTENPMKPAGEWNSVEIKCVGPKIVVRINGRQVQDVDQTTIAEIKDKPLCGYISLQNHGSPCAYRNVRLHVIKAE